MGVPENQPPQIPEIPNQGSAPADQLSGWKEIASYVGKGVRQAQRWEKLGMPVHRVQGMDGVVYAFRSEIDRWRRLTPPESMGVDSADSRHSVVEAESSLPSPPASADLSVARWKLVAGASVLAAGLTFGLLGGSPSGAVTQVRIVGEVLEARDSVGSLVWTFDLGFAALLPVDEDSRRLPLLTDLDNDGTYEVVVAVREGVTEDDLVSSDRLYAFSQAGGLRWVYSMPLVPYTFDGKTFTGPTRFLSWEADGQGNTWVSVNHHTWWPGVVVRIDGGGRGEVRYVQSGGVYALRAWRAGQSLFMLAGGIDNEYRLASVAVLDTAGDPAVSPQTPGSGFHCDNCAAGAPIAFMLLPRTDIGRASSTDPYSYVTSLDPVGERIKVATYEGEDVVFYHLLRPDLTIETLPAPDNFQHVHARLEGLGRLTHRFLQCPYRTAGHAASVWRRGQGWTTKSPTPAASSGTGEGG